MGKHAVVEARKPVAGVLAPDPLLLATQVTERTAALIAANGELLRAEQAIRERGNRLKGLLDAIPDAVWLKDLDGRLLAANAAFARFVGLPAEQVVGQRSEDLFSPETADSFAIADSVTVSGGRPRRYEEKLQDKDGNWFWFETVNGPLLGDNGAVTGTVGIARDITERKRVSEQIKAMNSALEQRSAELRALASELTLVEQRERRRFATLLHENLQQSLVGAQLRTDLLVEQLPAAAQRKTAEEIRTILGEALRQTRTLCADLAVPVLYDFGLAAALRWQGEQVREQCGLAVRVDAAEGAQPAAESVRVLLFQSVRELLLNIVKHAQAKSVAVHLHRQDHHVRLEVFDDGVGFAVDGQAAEVRKSGGFGLFSIRERLAQMGGRMEIDSAPGRGTRVALIVPVDYADRSSAPVPAPAGTSGTSALTPADVIACHGSTDPQR